MRRQRNKQYYFICLALNSLGAIFGLVGLMFVFARSFGELAIPAIHIMSLAMYLPITFFTIGIVGWAWAKYSDW